MYIVNPIRNLNALDKDIQQETFNQREKILKLPTWLIKPSSFQCYPLVEPLLHKPTIQLLDK